jgi:flagellar basal-body rod modification protein FlgD
MGESISVYERHEAMKEVTASLPAHLKMDDREIGPKAKNTMGKDDFMKLLMAQLQNQDPLKPVDHHEFVAQLAQFGSLEQLTNIQKGIEGLHSGSSEESKVSALSMIGKRIEAVGSQVELLEGQAVTLSYTPRSDLTPIKAQIYTEGGKLLREIELGGKVDPKGIQWDGKDLEGRAVPTGRYTFRVQGVDAHGQAQEFGTELAGKVVGVEMNGKNPLIVVKTASGNTKIELAKIKNVSADDGNDKNNANSSSSATSPVTPNLQSPQKTQVSIPRAQGSEDESTNDSDVPADGAIASTADLERMWAGFPGLDSLGSVRP